jgi:hypothetical protein
MAITRKTTQTVPAAPQMQAPMYAPPTPNYALQQAPQQAGGVDFLDMSFYSGGFLVPKGNYVITSVQVRIFKGERQQAGQERLGVMITLVPLADPREESKHEQFYSMGSKMHLGYMPNATGTGIVPIPNAAGVSAPGSTNWALFLKTLYDCGMPKGWGTNDSTKLEGIWVYITHVDEPAEREGFTSNTTEFQAQQRAPRKIAVVGEILQGGMPWAGGGGWPDKPVNHPTQVNGAPGLPINSPLPPSLQTQGLLQSQSNVPAPPPPAGVDMVSYMTIAQHTIGEILENAAKQKVYTLQRLAVRNDAFNLMKAKYGEQSAGTVLQQVFDTAGVLDAVLGDIGYVVNGPMIQPR